MYSVQRRNENRCVDLFVFTSMNRMTIYLQLKNVIIEKHYFQRCTYVHTFPKGYFCRTFYKVL